MLQRVFSNIYPEAIQCNQNPVLVFILSFNVMLLCIFLCFFEILKVRLELLSDFHIMRIVKWILLPDLSSHSHVPLRSCHSRHFHLWLCWHKLLNCHEIIRKLLLWSIKSLSCHSHKSLISRHQWFSCGRIFRCFGIQYCIK